MPAPYHNPGLHTLTHPQTQKQIAADRKAGKTFGR